MTTSKVAIIGLFISLIIIMLATISLNGFVLLTLIMIRKMSAFNVFLIFQTVYDIINSLCVSSLSANMYTIQDGFLSPYVKESTRVYGAWSSGLLRMLSCVNMALIVIDRFILIKFPTFYKKHIGSKTFLYSELISMVVIFIINSMNFLPNIKLHCSLSVCTPDFEGTLGRFIVYSAFCVFILTILVDIYNIIELNKRYKNFSKNSVASNQITSSNNHSRLILIMVTVYLVTWLPFFIMMILSTFNKKIRENDIANLLAGRLSTIPGLFNPIFVLVKYKKLTNFWIKIYERIKEIDSSDKIEIRNKNNITQGSLNQLPTKYTLKA